MPITRAQAKAQRALLEKYLKERINPLYYNYEETDLPRLQRIEYHKSSLANPDQFPNTTLIFRRGNRETLGTVSGTDLARLYKAQGFEVRQFCETQVYSAKANFIGRADVIGISDTIGRCRLYR